MACPHRFFGLHINSTLFPDWEIDHLFIGTFNPLWDRPNSDNAEYFYDRSAYFWDALSIFFEDKRFDRLGNKKQRMLDFCRKHKIGFTDLITSIIDADLNVEQHKKYIYTVLDTDLEKFDSIKWNTQNIIDYITLNSKTNVYFTLLSKNPKSIFTREIEKIESAARKLSVSAKRLHSPTGANLGKGSPRLHQLVERWSIDSNLPKINLDNYPYTLNSSSSNSLKSKKTSDQESVIIMNTYKLTKDSSGTYAMFDISKNEELLVMTTIINKIIPDMVNNYDRALDLYSKNGMKTKKNTRTIAGEVMQFYRSLQ